MMRSIGAELEQLHTLRWDTFTARLLIMKGTLVIIFSHLRTPGRFALLWLNQSSNSSSVVDVTSHALTAGQHLQLLHSSTTACLVTDGSVPLRQCQVLTRSDAV